MLRISYSDLHGYKATSPGKTERRLVTDCPALLREILNDNLTKKQKWYIMLYYRDGLTVMQIAERCGVNKSTVSRTINRGKKRLMNAINCKLAKDRLAGTQNGE